ncbi:hypothetical protein TNIN_152221 [Trichonephila inaurata madagascariensis]|uniref:Uncharacterized protein n=1 Tax=Trichonephila inaurata madagascariensis TaxID=2747483 RepID=A0A8X6M9I1_9ARAC|nr:hypothetical protein TNIN_152221 [Trichonephila inaurata madagascariensis]
MEVFLLTDSLDIIPVIVPQISNLICLTEFEHNFRQDLHITVSFSFESQLVRQLCKEESFFTFCYRFFTFPSLLQFLTFTLFLNIKRSIDNSSRFALESYASKKSNEFSKKKTIPGRLDNITFKVIVVKLFVELLQVQWRVCEEKKGDRLAIICSSGNRSWTVHLNCQGCFLKFDYILSCTLEV